MSNPTAIEAFFAKVDVAWNGCWLWAGPTTPEGYGQWNAKRFPGYSRGAHRASWELLVGPIPPGLHMDHLCRVPACVNPDHLEPVTREENTRRGYGWTAMNGRKTHCFKGHALTTDNIYDRPSKRYGRICKKCQRARVAASKAKKVALQSSAT